MPMHLVPVAMSPRRWQSGMQEWVPQGGKKKGGRRLPGVGRSLVLLL